MSEFAVVITCHDENNTVLVLDTVEENNISSSSTMTSHPIISGDIIGDHIYNNQSNYSFSGVFSLNGSKGNIVTSDGKKFTEIQEFFEKLKKTGTLCDIVKIHTINGEQNNQEARFKLRQNMVLTNITWNEGINTLKYSFNFTETLLVDVDTEDVDVEDEYLPDISSPKSMNFTDTIIDWNQIDAIVISQLRTAKIITDDFLDYFVSGLKASAIGLAVGGIAGLATGIAVAAVAAPPVSTIAAGAALVVAAGFVVGKAIVNFVKSKKSKWKTFKLYKNAKKNEQEAKRFEAFLNGLHESLNELNSHIVVYQVSSDSTPQECILSIDNNTYVYKFTKNNTTNDYDLSVTDLNDKIIGIKTNLSTCPESLADCSLSNILFKTSLSYCYIINPNEVKNKLTNYYILVSNIDLQNYNNLINDYVKAYLSE